VQEINNFFALIVGFWGMQIQVCYPNFQGSKVTYHGKVIIRQNCTDFISVLDLEKSLVWIVGSMGLANSSMLSRFSREQRELPWQPDVGKISRIALISVLCKKAWNFSC